MALETAEHAEVPESERTAAAEALLMDVSKSLLSAKGECCATEGSFNNLAETIKAARKCKCGMANEEIDSAMEFYTLQVEEVGEKHNLEVLEEAVESADIIGARVEQKYQEWVSALKSLRHHATHTNSDTRNLPQLLGILSRVKS